VTISASEQVFTPSIPEFTLKYVDHSYDVPSTTSSAFNPYNNQTTITTIPGYHVQNFTIDLIIKNQPIPSTLDGNQSYLLFYVKLKGHYGNDWIYPYGEAINAYPKQSTSDYTVISLPTSYSYGVNTTALQTLQVGDKIDFQVKAILAYGYLHYLGGLPPEQTYDYYSVSASDWSSTQTIIIPDSYEPTPSIPSQSSFDPSADSGLRQSSSGVVFGLSWGEVAYIATLSVTAAVLIVTAFFVHKKHAKKGL
jgi:hypothetical protein